LYLVPDTLHIVYETRVVRSVLQGHWCEVAADVAFLTVLPNLDIKTICAVFSKLIKL